MGARAAAGNRLTSAFRSTSPDALLQALGIEKPSQICLEAIAWYCGVTLLHEPLEGSEARLIGYGERAIVTVNAKSLPSRQRFSAAHELGHWMWDRGGMAFECASRQLDTEWSGDTKEGPLKGDLRPPLPPEPERRANRYAADLLLPPRLFQPRAQAREASFSTIRDLAREFQTSLTATAIRFVELARGPAALVCIEQDRRCWYVLSPPLRAPRGASGWERAAGAPEPADCEHIPQWLEKHGRVRGAYRLDTRPVGNRRTLSLYTWH